MAKFNRTKVKPATGSSPDRRPSRLATGTTYEGARRLRPRRQGRAVPARRRPTWSASRPSTRRPPTATSGTRTSSGTVAVADPEWTARLPRWLRGDANMRSASLVGALEAAKAHGRRRRPRRHGRSSRPCCSAPTSRARRSPTGRRRYGRAIPKPVKRGVADAVGRLYTEYAACSSTTPRRRASGSPTSSTWSTRAGGALAGRPVPHRARPPARPRTRRCPTSLPMLVANAELRAAAVGRPGGAARRRPARARPA